MELCHFKYRLFKICDLNIFKTLLILTSNRKL